MSDIKDRIKAIKPYFREMQVVNDNDGSVIYVSVIFPNKWIIADDIKEKYKVTVVADNTTPNKYFFCADIEEGFDSVFDAIDYNVLKMKTAQERAMLFQNKLAELQELFEDESISLDVLRTINFSKYMLGTSTVDTVSDNIQKEDNTKSTDNEVSQEEGIISKITGRGKKRNKNIENEE